MGLPPAGQPIAVATLTVGMSDVCGGGRAGFGPMPDSTDIVAGPAHAARRNPVANTEPRDFNKSNVDMNGYRAVALDGRATMRKNRSVVAGDVRDVVGQRGAKPAARDSQVQYA